MTVYRPHGYIDYNDFFHRILDVLLKDNSEKQLIKENLKTDGLFLGFSPYRFSFCEIEDRSKKDLEDLLDDFELCKNKTIYFKHVQIERQHLKLNPNFETYTIYYGHKSEFLFNSYENGLYSVREEIGKHNKTKNGDEYHRESCYQKKDGEVISHYKIVNLPCHCGRETAEKSFSRLQFLSLFYANRVWNLMRNGLCEFVETAISTNPNDPIKKDNWFQENWWYSVLIGGRMRDAGREAQYLFKEADVRTYCQEILPERLYGRTTTGISVQELYQRECEKTADLETQLKEIKAKMLGITYKNKGLIKSLNKLRKSFFALYFGHVNKVNRTNRDVAENQDIQEIDVANIEKLLSAGGDKSANLNTIKKYKKEYQEYLDGGSIDPIPDDEDEGS